MPRPARGSTESIFLNCVDQSRIWPANVEISASLPRLSVYPYASFYTEQRVALRSSFDINSTWIATTIGYIARAMEWKVEFPACLQSTRVLVRPINLKDENAVFAYASNRSVSRFLTWAPHRSLDETRVFLAQCSAFSESRRTYAILKRDDQSLCGATDLRLVASHIIN